MPKSRTSAALSLLLVFVSGALVGVLAHRAYITRIAAANANPPRIRRDPAEFRRHYINDMRERVKLTDAQVSQVNQILDEVDFEMRRHNEAMQTELTTKINGILSPEQQPLYAQWREERLRRNPGRHPGGPPPPPPPGEKK